jgi:glucose/arabinose dehydrogenase
MEQPLKQWTPSIAVCGLDFVRGEAFKKWENRLLVGALAFEELRLVTLDESGAKVVDDQILLKGAGRVRDVRCGPDGAIYVVLNAPDIILRLTPRK